MPSIDTLQVFDHLKKAFSEEQAHILSQILSKAWEEAEAETTATNKDITGLEAALTVDIRKLELRIAEVNSNLERKIAEVNSNLEFKIAEVSSNLELKIAEVSSNLELKIAETKTLIAQTKADILKWMVGFLLAQTGVIAALVKLL